MALKILLGLAGEKISESEIVAKIEQAKEDRTNIVEFTLKDGSKIRIELPSIDPGNIPYVGE
jgi:hypothetical protein